MNTQTGKGRFWDVKLDQEAPNRAVIEFVGSAEEAPGVRLWKNKATKK